MNLLMFIVSDAALDAIANNIWGLLIGVLFGSVLGYIVGTQKLIKTEMHVTLETIQTYVKACEESRLDHDKEKQSNDS